MRRADESTEDQTPGPEDSPQPEVSHTDVAQRADGAKPPPVDDEGSAAGPGPKQGPSGGKLPLVIFLILLAAIASIIAISIATQDQDESGFTLPAGEPLAESGAIEQLRHLLMLRNQAFEDRNLGGLSAIYTSSSPVLQLATREMQQLIDDDVRDESNYESLSISLISASPTEVILEEEVRIEPKFVTEAGEDVTANKKAVVRTVTWTLRIENGLWQIHDSVIEASRTLSDAN